MAPISLAVPDLNGDGIPDLAVADNLSSSVYVLTGNRNGTFNSAVAYNAATAGISITISDFNGDGHPDIAELAESGQVAILLNNGDGTFTSRPGFALSSASRPSYIAADAVCVSSTGAQTPENVFAVSNGAVIPAPLNLSACSQTLLILYATGMDKATAGNVQVSIGGAAASVKSVGRQGFEPGLDQIEVAIPQSLSGKGNVQVVVTAGGQIANTVNVAVR